MKAYGDEIAKINKLIDAARALEKGTGPTLVHGAVSDYYTLGTAPQDEKARLEELTAVRGQLKEEQDEISLRLQTRSSRLEKSPMRPRAGTPSRTSPSKIE